MCAGAIVHSRVKRLIYGAKEPKAGAIESQAELLRAPYINYRVEVEGGICEQESSELISAFFTGRRAQQREQKKKEENE
jgi:tRNA(adenine34) deaminase